MTAEFVFGAYRQLFQIGKSFRMAKSDLQARTVAWLTGLGPGTAMLVSTVELSSPRRCAEGSEWVAECSIDVQQPENI